MQIGSTSENNVHDMRIYCGKFRAFIIKCTIGYPICSTNNRLLPYICHDIPVKIQLHKRFIKFFNKVRNSNNNSVSTCDPLTLNGSQSSACHFLNFIPKKYAFHKFKLKNVDLLSFMQCINKVASTEVGEIGRASCRERV